MRLSTAALVFVAMLPRAAWAGACLDPIEEYLQAIEQPKPDGEDPLKCLNIVYGYLELSRAEALERGDLATVRADRKEHAALAERILGPRLKGQKGKDACQTAKALATFQVASAYEGLEQCPADEITALAYGLLGDQRAEPKLIEWFNKSDQRYKKNRALAFAAKLDILNALVEIGGPQVKALVDELAKDPRSKFARFIPLARAKLTH